MQILCMLLAIIQLMACIMHHRVAKKVAFLSKKTAFFITFVTLFSRVEAYFTTVRWYYRNNYPP